MNKKRTIIIVGVIVIVLVIALILGLLLKNNNGSKKDEVAMITLDINPSLEIEIQDGKANRINPLNEEAGELIDRKFEGKPLEDVLQEIVVNAREKGYMEDDHLSIILGMEKNDKKIEDMLRNVCEKQHIRVEIVVPEITDEAKKEAQGYGVTPAKAAYILELIKDNGELHFDDLKDKSVIELHEMKQSGNWCNQGYVLHGSDCEKAIREEEAQEGQTCPRGTVEYKDKCYDEGPMEETEELECHEGFELNNGKCINKIIVNAAPSKYECSKGYAKTRYEAGLTGAKDGDAKDVVCVDASNATHPVTPCEAGKAGDGTEYLESGGKCYWHRAPVIDSGCPGKVQVGGDCWDDATGIYICIGNRDGKRYSSKDEFCEGSIKYTQPTVTEYKCQIDYILEGNKCIKNEEEDPHHVMGCSEGYTKADNNRCLDMEHPKEKEKGYICPNEARLEKNKCVYYETMPANRK